MRELAVQSANDTNTDDDRNEIQKEIDQLTSEVNRIANTTEFNTKKLLNGDSGSKVNFGANGNVVNASATENTVAGSYAIAVTTAAEQATTAGAAFVNGDIDASLGTTGTIKVNGNDITFAITTGDAAATAASFISALNNANIGITATGDEGGIDLTTNAYGAEQSITIEASALTEAMGLTADDSTDKTDVGVDVAGTIGGATASGKGTTLIGTGDAAGLKVTLTNTAASTVAAAGSIDVTQSALTMHIGANKDQNMTVSVRSMTASDLGINALDLTSQSGANSAISTLDDAIKEVSAERSKLGAYQNRLDHTINNLNTSSENLTAAESRVRDVDYALAA